MTSSHVLLVPHTVPPGPPGGVIMEEITDTTAQLSWSPGIDNHSPISMYTVQARTPFSVGWQALKTGKRCSKMQEKSR